MYLGNDNSLGVRASGSSWGQRYLKRWEKQRGRPGSRRWRDINIPRVFQKPVDLKDREASILGYIKKGTGGYKKGELIHKGGRLVKFGEKPPPAKLTELSKAGPSGLVQKTFRRPAYMRGGRLGQWEMAIPAAAGVAAKIFGGKKEDKKAASIARRSGDAMKGVSVIQPLSNLVTQSVWDNIQRSFLNVAQTGGSFGDTAPAIAQGGYEFATKASQLINSTPPSSVIRKSGGFASWTALQQRLTALVSQMKPSPVSAPVVARPVSTMFKPPTVPGASPYLPTPPPTPQIITMPAPSQVIESAPVQAGIDPMWLMMGGLGLAAVMMMK